MDTSNDCIFLLSFYFIFSPDLRYMTASLIRELQRLTPIGFLCTMIIAQILMRRRLGSQKFLNSNSIFQFSKCRLLRKFHSGSGSSRSNRNRKKTNHTENDLSEIILLKILKSGFFKFGLITFRIYLFELFDSSCHNWGSSTLINL